MIVAEAVAYALGLVTELWGVVLVIKQARRALAARANAQPIKWGEVEDLNISIAAARVDAAPSWFAVGLLLAGIVFGYLGNFLGLAA